MFAAYSNPRLPTRPRPEDPDDVRLGAFVRAPEGNLEEALAEVKATDFVILGYPDDRGVDRNGGRLGASEAPDAIRKFLYNMTPDPMMPPRALDHLRIWDIGNLKCWSLTLPEAHARAREALAAVRKTGARVITFGGGHDWAYPDFVDFTDHLINIDAHLDMRPVTKSPETSAHSGTPFRRLVAGSGDGSKLGVLGLQRHCNARHHVEFARGVRASLLFLDELPFSLDEQWRLVQDRFSISKRDAFGLSIDMDAFAQGIAPGVSAPQSYGVEPRLVEKLLHEISPRTKHLGIYELNPAFDRDGETARLAAKLVHMFISASTT